MKTNPGKLELIAKLRGKPLHDLMVELFERYDGSPTAMARDLGVAPFAVRRWLERNGYQPPPGPKGWIKKTESGVGGDYR